MQIQDKLNTDIILIFFQNPGPSTIFQTIVIIFAI